MLETEWAYYKDNRDKLVEKYCDKFVVISGNEVVSVYDDQKTAYYETKKNLPLGSFMIHHITKEEKVIRLSPFAANA